MNRIAISEPDMLVSEWWWFIMYHFNPEKGGMN
jgi:hypothetical protein